MDMHTQVHLRIRPLDEAMVTAQPTVPVLGADLLDLLVNAWKHLGEQGHRLVEPPSVVSLEVGH